VIPAVAGRALYRFVLLAAPATMSPIPRQVSKQPHCV